MFLTKKTTHLTDLKGLANNFKVLSFIFAITLFSMGGLPPLGGFFVKFEIFYSLIHNGFFFISYVLFILTLFNFFYYLRIIKILYFENTKILKKYKKIDLFQIRIISILIFILPLYIIIFGDS
jgi:NADH-quinone oxidoreductase subunit N